jgi:hypothetical protein
METEWNYFTIKREAKRSGRSVKDLIALGNVNDPFYIGQPACAERGRWFADLWGSGAMGNRTHLRGIHYILISGETAILMPDGRAFENTDLCWNFLAQASKAARYLGLVDARLFRDQKSRPAQIFTEESAAALPLIEISSDEYFFDIGVPVFPDPPTYEIERFSGVQKYLIEIWIEKSTMSDELEPLCKRYGCNLVTGVGELSISQCVALVDRIVAADRPCRVLYISDFDPGGKSMPVAVSRKIEFYQRNEFPDIDVQVNQILLTEDQCRKYKLPRTPLKDSERRGAKWEEKYGEGATELDALEALYPGEFSKIVRTEIERFFDTSLVDRCDRAYVDISEELDAIQEEIMAEYDDEINDLRAEYDEVKEKFEAEVRPLMARIASCWHAITTEMEAADLPDIDVPVAELDHENEWQEPLYDSGRDYEKQIAAYKRFQNGE